MIRYILYISICLLVLTGCIVSKAGAYKVFGEDLEDLIDTPFKDSYVYLVGYLDKLEPLDVKVLANGNKILVYEVAKIRNQNCKVFIEVNSKSQIIVEATSKGNECWRPY